MKYKHLFGPVVSRRLGISLGVDIVPYKHCSLNCVYCEVSRTTHLTLKRKSFFPITEIIEELDDFMKDKPELDYITFSGAGEPTLNLELGQIITYIKTNYPDYKLALITNGTLLTEPELRQEVLSCDLILPSLDAASQQSFEIINRPHAKLDIHEIIKGLSELRDEYRGQMWLEIFIVPGINDHLLELEMLKASIRKINPDLVQLNSLDRPGAEQWVEPTIYLALEEIRAILQDGLKTPVEIIAKTHQENFITLSEEKLITELTELLQKDMYSKQELAKEMQIHVNEVSKLLQYLAFRENLKVQHTKKGIFYQWKK